MRNMIQYSSIWMPEFCGGAIVGRFQGRGFAGGGAGSSSCLLALASSVTGFGHCFKPPSTLCADASCPHRRCILITKTYHILVQRRHLRCWVRLPRRLFLLPVRQRSCFSPGRVSSSASAPEACAVVAGDAQIDGGDARRPSRRHSLSDVFEDGRCSWSPSGCDQEHGSGLDHLSTMDSTSLLPASQQLLGSWLLASLEGEEMKTASQTGDSDSLLLVDNFCEEIGFPTPASRWWDRNSSDSHFRWLVPQSLPKKPVQGKLSYATMAARPGDGWATSWGNSSSSVHISQDLEATTLARRGCSRAAPLFQQVPSGSQSRAADHGDQSRTALQARPVQPPTAPVPTNQEQQREIPTQQVETAN